MVALAHPRRQPPPNARDVTIARAAGRNLARYAGRKRPLAVRVAGEEEVVELPAGAVALLKEILDAMSAGQGVVIIPENAELTTVQAAGLLNVSRPFLIGLLEKGALPYRTVGTHRRIRIEDVMSYKADTDRKRNEALDEIVRETEKLGLYDKE